MASAPQIKVYVSLPIAVGLGADLNVDPTNWLWVHCLSLPLATLLALHLSQRPYKWICYAIGIVIGAEGVLSDNPGSLNIWTATLASQLNPPCYIITPATKRSEECSRSILTSVAHTSLLVCPLLGGFNSATRLQRGIKHSVSWLRWRRGYATPCTFWPTARAIRYATLTLKLSLLTIAMAEVHCDLYSAPQSRSTGNDIIQDIDSVRNGLFLNTFTHRALGTDVAFLIVRLAFMRLDWSLMAPISRRPTLP